MPPPFILIGVAAGLASAALFASATMGGLGGRLLLYFLAPLPVFLAGLGWGSASAAIAAVATAAGCALLLTVKGAAVILLTQGIPVAVLCHLAQLNRTVAIGDVGDMRRPPATTVEWYPVGRLMAAAVWMSGAIAFFTVFLLASSLDDLRKIMRGMLEEFLKSVPALGDRKLTEADLAALTDVAVHVMPALAALFCLGGLLVNFYLAGRITLASGRLPRPWPDLALMSYPRGFGLGLAASLLLTWLLPGYSALAASSFAGAFLLAFTLLGLAIVHAATRGTAARPFILAGVYLALFILNTWAAVALAIIGTLEPVLPFRRRPAPPRPPPDATS